MADPHRGCAGQVRFHLEIREDELLRFYRGEASSVHVTAEDGRRVRFPAEALRPYVERDGVRGVFLLRFDARGRLLGLDRLASGDDRPAEVRA